MALESRTRTLATPSDVAVSSTDDIGYFSHKLIIRRETARRFVLFWNSLPKLETVT